MRPSILLVDNALFVGGAEIYQVRLARFLKSEARVLAITGTEDLAGFFRAAGVDARTMPVWGRSKFLKYFAGVILMAAYIIRYRPQFVHLNGQAESNMALLARVLGSRVIITRHTPVSLMSGPLKQWLYRQNARLAYKVVCVSEVLADEHRGFLREDKILTIRNWVNRVALNRKTTAVSGFLKIAFIGRLVREKGILELLEAVRGVDGVSLCIVGTGPLHKAVEAASGPNVTLVGFRSEIGEYHAAADLIVVPSHPNFEGSSLVSLEAMAALVPCLVSDVAVLREISGDGRAAKLFRCGDVADMRAKIIELRDDPEQRKCLAKQALQFLEERHSPEGARDSYLRVFEVPV